MHHSDYLCVILISLLLIAPVSNPAQGQRQVEHLDRGLLAVRISQTEVYVGWRMTGSDPDDIAFNLYRSPDGLTLTKLNDDPIISSTNWIDIPPGFAKEWIYIVKPIRGKRFYPSTGWTRLKANSPIFADGQDLAYISIPFKTDIEAVNRVGIGDLDGDGFYDFVVKHPQQISDPGVFVKSTDTFKYDAYLSTGEFLWRVDLGWNIVQGIWWSPMQVFDLDGDGRAEVISKTAPKDVDYREPSGRVLSGPEYFTIFDGLTGKELARADWIPRGNLCDWGDCGGNRGNRNQMGIAYLDGKRPSLIIFRGTYGLMKAEAWNYRDNQLTRVWSWSNQDLGPEYQSQGFHNIRVGDIDNDGKDEIINGAIAIDDDGATIYSTGQGHGDRFFLADIDPEREGLEVWYIQEDSSYYDLPTQLVDAGSGEFIFGKGKKSWGDVGTGFAADIDPRFPGLEVWSRFGGLYSATGIEISAKNPRHNDAVVCEHGVWWDDDLQREMTQDGRLLKFNHKARVFERMGTTFSRTKLTADVLGDWREEIICVGEREIRVFSTTTLSNKRFRTFMHDPIYRLDVSFMTMGYDQSPNTSFYFGEGMSEQPDYKVFTSQGTDTSYINLPAKYDFGCRNGCSVKEDYSEILPIAGNGWLDHSGLESSLVDTSDALLADQIFGWEPGVLQIPVRPGEYKVIIHSGSQEESCYTRILAEDKPYLDLVTSAGKFKTDSFIVQVEDSLLDLVFGGSPWRISGIEIKKIWPLSTTQKSIEAEPLIFLDHSNGLLHINSTGPVDNLCIWNIIGQLCFESSLNSNKTIDVSNFQPGTYIIRLRSDKQMITRKVFF